MVSNASVASEPTLHAETLRLTGTPRWLQLPGSRSGLLTVTGVAHGAPIERGGAALLAVQFDRPLSAAELAGTGLSASERVGPYVYIEPTPAGRPFRLDLRIPAGARAERLSFQPWNSEAGVTVTDLRVLQAPVDRPAKLLVNISVDVEALPGRAPSDHLDRLIYGRFNGGEYGVPLHMRLYRELGVPATFYLEYAACALYGDEAVIEIGKRIAGEGFDLQLHTHPEVLARAKHFEWSGAQIPSFSALDKVRTRLALEFALERYHATVGRAPDCFRAGAFHFNPYTIEVGAELGLPAFSNYRVDHRGKNPFEFAHRLPGRPFQWANGVLELPITLSPEPLGVLSPGECWRRLHHHAETYGTWLANVVIHSWSFTHRNAEGHHEFRDLSLFESLRAFIEAAPPEVEFVAISDVVRAVRAGQIGVPEVRQAADLIPNAR